MRPSLLMIRLIDRFHGHYFRPRPRATYTNVMPTKRTRSAKKRTSPAIVPNPDILDFSPPPPEVLRAITAPLRAYFRPTYHGLNNIKKDRPALLVGNHTLFGALDWPLYISEIYAQRGVVPRSLTDRMHYTIPIWREFVGTFGNVLGTRENCAALMDARQHVLVFPGGAREICKRKGEAYHLTWKERTGFAYMAIAYRYPILPFASVGPDDTYDILIDGDEIMASPLGKLLNATGIAKHRLRGGDIIPPIVRGLGLTLLPRPEPFYFAFGKPFSTKPYWGQQDKKGALRALRLEVEDAIMGLIGDLQARRVADETPSALRVTLNRL